MANSLTDALRFKKAIGAPTKGLYPGRTEPHAAGSQGHGMLHFHKSKVPNLGASKAGDQVTLQAHGVIHAADPNGNMVMHVHDVKPDSQAMEKTQHPEQKVPVRGVESRTS